MVMTIKNQYIVLASIVIVVLGLIIFGLYNNLEQQRQQSERLTEELYVAKQTPIPTPTPTPDKNKVIVDTTPHYITLWYGKYYSNYEDTPGVSLSIRNENDVPVKIIIDCSKAFPPGISCNLAVGNGEFDVYPHSTINPSFKVMMGLFTTSETGRVDYKYKFGTPVLDTNTIISCCSANSMSILARIPITVTPECNKNEINCDSGSV